MNELKKETVEALENGICLQMDRLTDEETFGPNDWNQIANAGANILDKLTNLNQQTEQMALTRKKNEIELKRLEIELKKVECDLERNKIDSEKLKTQKEIEMRKIELDEKKFEFDKEARLKSIDIEDKKAEASVVNANAATTRADNELKAAEIKATSDVKAETNWKKYAVEAAKIVIPAAISVITLKVWNEKMGEIMQFEETGKFCTAAANKFLKLPHLNGF